MKEQLRIRVQLFDESNSLSSTNLPETIGLTSFGGTGEKPCEATAVERVRFVKKKTARGGGEPCRDAGGEGETDDTGGEKS